MSNQIQNPINSLFHNFSAWGIDESHLQSWNIVTPISQSLIQTVEPINTDERKNAVETREMSTSTDDSDFYVLENLKECKHFKVLSACNRDININVPDQSEDVTRSSLMVDKSCLTDDYVDDQLEHLKKVFPDVSAETIVYWYNKYNRDIGRTMKSLLFDDQKVNSLTVDSDTSENKEEINDCSRVMSESNSNNSSISESSKAKAILRHKKHKRKSNSSLSEETEKLKKCIESKIDIASDHYSRRVWRMKQSRSCQLSSTSNTSKSNSSSEELGSVPDSSNDSEFIDTECDNNMHQKNQSENMELNETNNENHFVNQLNDEDEELFSQAEDNHFTNPIEIPQIMRDQRLSGRWLTSETLAAKLTKELSAQNDVKTAVATSNVKDLKSQNCALKNPPHNYRTATTATYQRGKVSEYYEDRSAAYYVEETDNLLKKRSKLFQKAQTYYLSGMKGIAQFYSQEAAQQTRLFERTGRHLATAFVEEHSKYAHDSHNLDLHFLYIKEALPTLDMFLDKRINLLRLNSSKHMEDLQVVTGRGRNSERGVAKLKPAVIARLKQRKICYHQLNPGLLRIRITKNTAVTNEL